MAPGVRRKAAGRASRAERRHALPEPRRRGARLGLDRPGVGGDETAALDDQPATDHHVPHPAIHPDHQVAGRAGTKPNGGKTEALGDQPLPGRQPSVRPVVAMDGGETTESGVLDGHVGGPAVAAERHPL